MKRPEGVRDLGALDFYIEKVTQIFPNKNMAYHHSSFELYCMVKDQRDCFIEDRFFRVKEGDIALIPRKVLHRTVGDKGVRYVSYFSEEFLSQYFTPAALQPIWANIPLIYRGSLENQNRIRSVLTELNELYWNEEEPDDARLAGGLFQVLSIMAYGTNYYEPENYADERIENIVHYINENYSKITDIEQIADHFFLSKSHLCRFFKKRLGTSLITYLNMVKIREACRLIQESGGNLSRIAADCGFNSESYFCKVFKAEKGVSPSVYKKQNQ